MEFRSQVSQALDREHKEHLALLGELERTIASARRYEPAWHRLFMSLSRSLEHEVLGHFEFEETSRFPRLADAGDAGIAQLLTEEHDAIREVADELRPLLAALAPADGAAQDWDALRRLALEYCDRQLAHIQKETMALLPMVDDLLDDQTDAQLALHYASS